jgi:benzoate transport
MLPNSDPRQLLDQSAMTRLQILVIVMTVVLNALDGFDILAISFASPGIRAEWGIGPAELGIVLSMELVGMGLGSLLLGGIADQLGRRSTVLSCLAVMAAGMYLATTAENTLQLSIWRILTGFGIGGMLSSTNALAAEFANRQRRSFCIAAMATGYSLGGVVGGFFASRLLEVFDWRSTFYLGAALTFLCIPVFYVLVPESVHWLTKKQPLHALERLNVTLRRMGHASLAALPVIEPADRERNISDIFSSRLLPVTVLLTSAYVLHTMTFYFVLKWVPTIVVMFGFNPASAGSVLTWASVGGVIGGVLFGFVALKANLKLLTMTALLGAGVFVAAFGSTPADLAIMSVLVMLAGIFCSAGVVGFYALMAHLYPTHARAFGTGFVISVGRGGAILSPIIAGLLFESGLALPVLGAVMGAGSILGLLVLTLLGADRLKTQA